MSSKKGRKKSRKPQPLPKAELAIEVETSYENKTDPSPTNDLPSPETTLSLIRKLQELRKTKVLTFIASPDVTIRGDVIEKIYFQLRSMGKCDHLDLFLYGPGGETEIPWRLITLIRDFTDHFSVLIPGIAHSAATHLAMGADDIIMGPLSELSPVDPARSHPLLPKLRDDGPPIPVSVQDLRHCVEFIKHELNPSSSEDISVSQEAMSHIISALFDKIHPLAIGAIQQSYALSKRISTKALETHMDPEIEREKIERIVNAFSDEFYSHHYRIGWKEARDTGLKVDYVYGDIWDTMEDLYISYEAYFDVARKMDDEKAIARPIVWIDSENQRQILEEIRPIGEHGKIENASRAQWISSPWTTN